MTSAPPTPLTPSREWRNTKWWEFELRFDRRLTRHEQRQLRIGVGESWSSAIGEDGIAPTTLISKWPCGEELRALERVLQHLPAARLRLAPLGADHTPECDCGLSERPCLTPLGSIGTCLPDLTKRPWWVFVDGAWATRT